MHKETLTSGQLARIVAAAKALGFSGIGIAAVEPMEHGADALAAWLSQALHGDMAYMAAHENRHQPKALLETARGMMVVALPYGRQNVTPTKLQGRVAAYARGADYHGVLKEKLQRLADDVTAIIGRSVMARPCVDTAPLLERQAAHDSGLGFIGKNTMAILPGVGSYALLGELLLDVALPPSAAADARCGACTACLDACPTRAFVDAYVLDARRCISYLTIEYRGVIPSELRTGIGNHVFGCDVCQDVCPFNGGRGATVQAPELSPHDNLSTPELIDWLRLTSSGYRRLVRGTALRRASRHQLARNAAIALGNSADPRAVAPLIDALQNHINALVRLHAAWALGALYDVCPSDTRQTIRRALTDATNRDEDPGVRNEAIKAQDALAKS